MVHELEHNRSGVYRANPEVISRHGCPKFLRVLDVVFDGSEYLKLVTLGFVVDVDSIGCYSADAVDIYSLQVRRVKRVSRRLPTQYRQK